MRPTDARVLAGSHVVRKRDGSEGRDEGQPLRTARLPSPAILVSWPARGRVKRTPWLLGRFLIEFIFAAGAQAALPAGPSPPILVAQAARGSVPLTGRVPGVPVGALQGALAAPRGPSRGRVGLGGGRL